MSWRGIPITGGVVNTRNPSALSPGEYEYARNVRLVAGDTVEVRRDYGRNQIVSVDATKEIVHMFVAAFESAGEFLVLVTKDSTDLHIETTPIDSATLTTQESYAHGGTFTKAWHVRRGDEYFIGTDAAGSATIRRNFVLNSSLSVRTMGMFDSSLTTAGASYPAGSSVANIHDVFVYWITEYNSSADIESGTTQQSNTVVKVIIPANGSTVGGLVWTGVEENLEADKIRVYRHYCGTGNGTSTPTGNTAGNYTEADIEAAAYISGRSALVGGLLGTFTGGFAVTDALITKYDPSIPYPQIFYERGGAVLNDNYLSYPQQFNMGCLFNDSLVVTDGTLIRFSPPGGPEYQPSINALYFLTERNDDVVGMHPTNDVLVVLTKGGTHRIDYLAHEADLAARLGKATRTVSRLDGCVGRYASCPVPIEGEVREFVAFLSHAGLRMTDGERVYDACPDWSVSGAGISGSDLANCVLVPDPANHRLRLYVPGASASTIWDFYYHNSILRNGRLRCLGDSTHDAVVKFASYGYVSGVPTLFTASNRVVYREGVGEIGGAMEFKTGWIRPSSPFSEIQLDGIAVEHDADGDGVVTMTAYGKPNEGPEQSVPASLSSGAYEETTQVAGASCRGAYVRAKVSVTGHSRLGSLWLDAKEDLGGAA